MAVEHHNEMQELIRSVHIPMLFYVPSEILTASKTTVLEGMDSLPIFDSLIIMKENGQGALYKEELHALEINKKEHIYNAAIFKLLEIKGRNNEDAFKFLIDKYISQVRSYHDVFVWLLDNAKVYIKDISNPAKTNLEFQMEITSQHLEELINRFSQFGTNATESIDTVLGYAKNIEIESKNQTSDQTELDINKGEIQHSKDKTQKRKKLVLATVEEVDEYLLRTVFNVKKPQNATKTPQ